MFFQGKGFYAGAGLNATFDFTETDATSFNQLEGPGSILGCSAGVPGGLLNGALERVSGNNFSGPSGGPGLGISTPIACYYFITDTTDFSRIAAEELSLLWDDIVAKTLQVIGSFDPNEKLGPNGFANNGFIPKGVSSQYTINFENLPDATAPASQVIVTDQLSENFDWRTFQLGEIAFGDTVVQVPGRRSHYTDDILMPNGLIARINAGLNIQTGVVTWTITAIDPETGKTHENPLLGLLPPNDTETHDGEGHVTFLIRPLTDIATGTEINNKAVIVFDTNEPIETNEVFSTVDNDAPSSKVEVLEEISDVPTFKVSWSGNDNGSDIAGYDIYVSDNGGKYTLWLGNTKDMSATYTGEPGHTYSFYSIARDNAGNVERFPEEPDTFTITCIDCPVPTLTEWGVLMLFMLFLCTFYKNKTNYVIKQFYNQLL